MTHAKAEDRRVAIREGRCVKDAGQTRGTGECARASRAPASGRRSMGRLRSATCGLALLAAACGASGDAPPRSPLADASTPPTGASATTTTPVAAIATAVAVVSTPPAGTAVAADLETATGSAIEMLAEWLGIPATQLAVLAAEAVMWPNACLGVGRPGVACAEVLTPGFRVLLADAFDGAHAVHLDRGGHGLWAGEVTVTGSVMSVDAAAGRLTLDIEGAALPLRAAPGTLWDVGREAPGLAGVVAGDAVVVAYDTSPDGAPPPVIAWLSLDGAGR